MKRALFSLSGIVIGLFQPLAAFQNQFQSTTDRELIGYGDFNGDGQIQGVLIDRQSGFYRIASPQADGSLAFSPPQSTGMSSLDAFSVGRITTTASDQIAAGGVLPNRTQIISPSAPGIAQVTAFTQGAGHRTLAAVDLALAGNDPTLMDLVIATGWFNSSATFANFQSLSSGLVAQPEGPSPAFIRELRRVRLNNSGQDFIAWLQNTGTIGIEQLVLADPLQPGDPPIDAQAGIIAGSRMIHGPFIGGGSNQFLFYIPGSSALQVLVPRSGDPLTAPVTHNLPSPISSIHHAPGSSQMGFVVIFGDGGSARLYTLNSSGAPVPGSIISAPAGKRFNGLLAPESGQYSFLIGSASGGSTEAVAHYVVSSSQLQLQSTQSLSPVGRNRGLSNVLMFAGEPFVNASAALTATAHIPDWTSSPTLGAGHVTVVREVSGPNGLANPTTGNMVAAPATTTHAVANQVNSTLSAIGPSSEFGPTAPAIDVAPPSGTYGSYFRVELTAQDPVATIHYRVNATGPWLMATGSAVIDPPNATLAPFSVDFFAELAGVRSPIRTASYAFAEPAGEIDTDADGVPDYVEVANGLDPTAGADSDGDGYTDMQEILAGTDPADPADFPTGPVALISQNAFNLALRPLSFDSATTTQPTRPSYMTAVDPNAPAPTGVSTFDVEGRLLASTLTRFNPQDSFARASAYFAGLPANEADLFLIAATDPNFAIVPDQSAATPSPADRGIELLALIPVPGLQLPPVDYVPTSEDPLAAASEWAAAIAQRNANLETLLIQQNFTFRDTVKLLLTERVLALLLNERDPAFDPDDFSLTGFRDPVPAAPVSSAALLALQIPASPSAPAFRLHAVFAAISETVDTASLTEVAAFTELARQAYALAGTIGFIQPGQFPSVVDTLRAFLRGSPLPGSPESSYAGALTLSPSEISTAATAATALRASLSPRLTTTFNVRVTPDSFSHSIPVLERIDNGNPIHLLDQAGNPFPFPRGLPLLPETELDVIAFTDRTRPPFSGESHVETLRVELARLPVPAAADLNQNGLADEWELTFIGSLNTNPFADIDGDGYSTLQEFLEQSNPVLASSVPTSAPIPTGPPPVYIEQTGSNQFRIRIDFPNTYHSQIGFRLQVANNLHGSFTESIIIAEPDPDGTYSLTIPSPISPEDPTFFRFRLFIR